MKPHHKLPSRGRPFSGPNFHLGLAEQSSGRLAMVTASLDEQADWLIGSNGDLGFFFSDDLTDIAWVACLEDGRFECLSTGVKYKTLTLAARAAWKDIIS